MARRAALTGRAVRCAVRSAVANLNCAETIVIGNIESGTDWSRALGGVDCVIHCAARAHVMRESSSCVLPLYREVNVHGTRRLAEQAAAYGVRRFIFVSSVKVNGERTAPGAPFLISDPAAPEDAYGQSKWEAEQVLREVADRTELEIVIVRPPLVYGLGAKGNFQRLIQLVSRGVPLPLGAVDNRRSFVGLDNLADFLICCIDHHAAAGQTFFVSDDQDLSTPEFLQRIGQVMDRRARLVPIPLATLRLAGRLIGKSSEVERLLGSLQIDISHARKLLAWAPLVGVDEGLRRAMNINDG